MDSAATLRLASCGGNGVTISEINVAGGVIDKVYEYAATGRSRLQTASWASDASCLAAAARGSSRVVMTFCKRGVITSTEMSIKDFEVGAVLFPRTNVRRVILGESGGGRRIWLYDAAKRKPEKEFVLGPAASQVCCLAANVNDSLLAAGCCSNKDGEGGGVFLLNNMTSRVIPLKGAEETSVSGLRFAYRRRSLLAVASESSSVVIWDCNRVDAGASACFSEHRAPSSGLAFSPVNDVLLLSVGLDKRCVFYDLDTGGPVNDFKTEQPLTAVEFLPDGQTVALGAADGSILLYDLRSFARPLMKTKMHSAEVSAILFQPKSDSSLSTSTSRVRLVASTSSAAKENSEPLLLSPVAAGGDRDSFSSQIFSPVRDLASFRPVSSSVAQTPESCHEASILSLSSFSPLKEHSHNSSYRSFNKSLSGTPLVSPLAAIREECSSSENDSGLKSKGEDFFKPKDVSTIGKKYELMSATASTVHAALPAEPITVASSSTFKPVTDAGAASTPSEKKVDDKTREEMVTELKHVITAFPNAFLGSNDINNVAAEPRSTPAEPSSEHLKHLTSYQREFLLNCVQEAMEEHCTEMRAFMWRMQWDMARSFQEQRQEMDELLKEYAVNQQLANEVQRLTKENEELRKYF